MATKITNIIIIFLMYSLIGCSSKQIIEVEVDRIPAIIPLYDNYWILTEDIKVEIFTDNILRDKFTVPKGFISDLSSIPIPFNLVLSKSGRYATAGIIHDYLYWEQLCDDRRIADQILIETMRQADNTDEDKKNFDKILDELRSTRRSIARNMFYFGVNSLGWYYWNENTEKRPMDERYVDESQLDKIMPGQRMRDIKPNLEPETPPEKNKYVFCDLN